MYNKLLIDYNIDLSRVYSVGMSNGGAMSYFLACDMSDKIAAIASVTGAMTSYQLSSCNPVHSTPILQIHGTNDTVVSFSSMQYGLEYWRSYNNCNLIADTILIPNYDLSDSSTVEHIIYGNGDDGVTTELFKITNGGHTWPGSNFNFGGTNFDINASEEVWKFLSKYDINGLINQSTHFNEIPEDKKIIIPSNDDLLEYAELNRNITFKETPRELDFKLQRVKGFAAQVFGHKNNIDQVKWPNINSKISCVSSSSHSLYGVPSLHVLRLKSIP